MIRTLRKCHLRMMLGLALVLPLLFGWGLFVRDPIPAMRDFGDTFQWPILPQKTHWERTLNQSELKGSMWTWFDGTDWKIGLEIRFATPRPDLLAYVSSEKSQFALNKAQLLGEMPSEQLQVFSLPKSWEDRDLVLSFYSLAHREIVGSCEIPRKATQGEEYQP